MYVIRKGEKEKEGNDYGRKERSSTNGCTAESVQQKANCTVKLGHEGTKWSRRSSWTLFFMVPFSHDKMLTS